MKSPPAFQFYPSDYLSSAKVQSMSLAAQGAYIRLLCYQWQDGFIPDEVRKLAPLCGSRVNNFETLWAQIKQCFDLEIEPGKIANRRMEDVRSKQLDYRKKQAEHGKNGASKRRVASGYPDESLKGKASSSSSSSSPIGKEEGKGKGKGESPAAEKRAGSPDAAADLFAAKHLELTGVPYVFLKADFVHLAKLRTAYGIGGKETPPGWDHAVWNYFASALGKNTLADLAVRYSVFHNSPVDGYNKPINHQHRGNGNGSKSKTEKTIEAAQRLRSRLDSEDSGSDERGDPGSDTSDLFGETAAVNPGSSS